MVVFNLESTYQSTKFEALQMEDSQLVGGDDSEVRFVRPLSYS